MMQVTIDGEAVPVPGSTLAEALQALRLHAPDRLVVGARADGAEVPQADLLNPPSRTPYAARLEFSTQPAGEVLREAVLESASRLSSAADASEHAARQVRRGEIDVAVRALGELLPVWQEAQEVAVVAGQLGFPLHDIERAVASLAGDLASLRTCLAGQDWATLGDLLEGEMPEQARRWHAMMLQLSEQAA